MTIETKFEVKLPIVVSLCRRSEGEREYTKCWSIEEARELLNRKTVNGFYYTIRAEYFDGGYASNEWRETCKVVGGYDPMANV